MFRFLRSAVSDRRSQQELAEAAWAAEDRLARESAGPVEQLAHLGQALHRLARESAGPVEVSAQAVEAVRRTVAFETAMDRLSVLDPSEAPTPGVLDEYLAQIGVASWDRAHDHVIEDRIAQSAVEHVAWAYDQLDRAMGGEAS